MGLGRVKSSYSKYLSGGEKRKLCIGIAMINDPEILVFDEPTSSVDPGSRESIYNIIHQNKKGMLSRNR